MRPFIGFSTDRHKTIRVPEGFFEDVLPQIGSMLEMKLTLYLFWRLARVGTTAAQRGDQSPRMVSMDELAQDVKLREAISQCKGPRSHPEAIREGLELAVARGTLLQLWVREEPNDISEGRAEQWYLLNTRDSRAWVDALASGQIDVMTTPLAMPPQAHANGRIRVIMEKPNIFALYEQNIGLLTPLLAEKLQDAEGRYPPDWVEAAFEEAVTNNKRSWRYIERILERWAAEGKNSGQDRGPVERALNPDKYTKGKYAFLFRPDRN